MLLWLWEFLLHTFLVAMLQLNLLEQTPPELAADISNEGIMLTGGGALLRGFDKLVSFATNMPVVISERPLDSVVDGTLICLENNFRNLYQNRNKNNILPRLSGQNPRR